MVNYENGKIYKLVCLTTGKTYIGSTAEPTLARRLASHVSSYNRYLNGKYHYITSFDILKTNDYEILLIESFPCKTKDELHARERHWTKQIDCVNKIKNQGLYNEIGALTYQKQYNKLNKEHITRYLKSYYNINKEKFAKKYKIIKSQKHQKYLKSLEEPVIQP